MAFDFIRWEQGGRNFARGEPPPWHSHEWAGVEVPQHLQDRDRAVAEARRPKRKAWPVAVLGFIAGLAIAVGKD